MASRLGGFIRDMQEIKKKREVDAAERDILTLLQGSSELGGKIAEPIDPSRGFDASLAPVGLPGEGQRLDLSNIKQTPVRESRSFQQKQLRLAAAEDKLSTALAPATPARGAVTSTGGITRTIDPSTGLQRGVDIGTATAPKAPAPSEKLYVNTTTGDRQFVNIRSSKDVKAAREAGFRPHVPGAGGGKKELSEERSRKRISQLETSIAKLSASKGADPLTLLLMRDNPEALAALEGNDIEAAKAAMREEIKFHRRQIPGKELSPEEARAEQRRRRNASQGQ